MFQVYFLRTTTGEVGSRIDAESCSWSIELNKIESLSVTLKKDKLRRVDRLWWSPWSGGVLLTFTDFAGREMPLVAGPIVTYGNETQDSLSFEVAGIRKIFEKRTIAQNLSFKNLSLGSIAWRVLEHANTVKPGGALPITHGSPDENTGHERNYEGWNLSNNIVDKRLTELSEVINGPDIMFRPVWDNKYKTKIRWEFVHGTEEYPFIWQDWTPDFDTTAAASQVEDVSISSAGDFLVSRVWATGSGEGDGVLRQRAETLRAIEEGSPFMETVTAISDADDEDYLYKKARGELESKQKMLDQVTLKFDAHSRKTPLGSFFVGDTANVTLRGWLTVPDGTRSMRIIKMNGSLDPLVTLDFQEASW